MSSPDFRREQQLWTGHPSRKGMLGLHVKFIVAAVVISAALIEAANSSLLSRAIAIPAAIVVDGFLVWFLRIYPRLSTFTVTSECIYDTRFNLRTWGSKTERARVSRIQNVTVEQSFVGRMFGIGTVDSNTAGEFEGDLFRWVGIRDPQHVASIIEDAMYGHDDADGDAVAPRLRGSR